MKSFQKIPLPRNLHKELKQAETAILRADKHKRNQPKKKRFSPESYSALKTRAAE